MSGPAVTFRAVRGQERIGEVVVLVNQQVDVRAARTRDIAVQGREHGTGIGVVLLHHLPHVTAQQDLVPDDEILDYHAAVGLERSLHLVGVGGHLREVEPERQIRVARRRGVMPDVQPAEQLVEPLPVVHAVVRLQHRHKQGLAEAAGAKQEEKVRLVLQ